MDYIIGTFGQCYVTEKYFFRMRSYVTSTPKKNLRTSPRISPRNNSPGRPDRSRIRLNQKQESSPTPKKVHFETETESSG